MRSACPPTAPTGSSDRPSLSIIFVVLLLAALVLAASVLIRTSAQGKLRREAQESFNLAIPAGETRSTHWSTLMVEGGDAIDWRISISADPETPYTLSLRCAEPFSPTLETRSPFLTGDHRTAALRWLRIEQKQGDEKWWVATAQMSKIDLEALASGKHSKIELGGRFYFLSSQALDECRELLQRLKVGVKKA